MRQKKRDTHSDSVASTEGHAKTRSAENTVFPAFYEEPSTPGGIRTCDLLVRNELLYPAELRGRAARLRLSSNRGWVVIIPHPCWFVNDQDHGS